MSVRPVSLGHSVEQPCYSRSANAPKLPALGSWLLTSEVISSLHTATTQRHPRPWRGEVTQHAGYLARAWLDGRAVAGCGTQPAPVPLWSTGRLTLR